MLHYLYSFNDNMKIKKATKHVMMTKIWKLTHTKSHGKHGTSGPAHDTEYTAVLVFHYILLIVLYLCLLYFH